MTRDNRDQDVKKAETWIDKTEKSEKPKKEKRQPVEKTPEPIAKEEPKKKKKKLVVKEVSPPKAKPAPPKEEPKKKELKKEINFQTTVGKNDMPFEEIKGREKKEGGQRKQR